MSKYIRLYKNIIKINWAYFLAYRANSINSLVGSAAWCIFVFLSIIILTSRSTTVYGLSRNEWILLSMSYNILVGIFYTLFAKNFKSFTTLIDKATLDNILLKPVDSQFLVSTLNLHPGAALRLPLGLLISCYFLKYQMHYIPTFVDICLFFSLLMAGVMTMYSIWFCICLFMIISPRLSNLLDLLYHINGLVRYPRQMLAELMLFFAVIFFPLGFVLVTPLNALLGRATWQEVAWLLSLCVTFFVMSRVLWKYSLRFYTSASG